MKKYFIFAAIATAGLFASCSSSDDFVANDGQNPIENSDDVAIKISVAQPTASITRGTGTVGGVVKTDNTNNTTTAVANDGTTTNPTTNNWSNQIVNVYMFEKGSLTVAKFNGAEIYNNAPLRTPKSAATGIADYMVPSTDQTYYDNTQDKRYIKYYPMAGQFDFWGYRIDDATAAAPAVDGNVLKTVISVDGTQDVLSGVTEAPAYDALNTDQKTAVGGSETAYETYKTEKLYSASAARNALQPNLKFSHMMTRLTFDAYKGSAAAGAYTDETGGTASQYDEGIDTYNGVYIDTIMVRAISVPATTTTTATTPATYIDPTKGTFNIAGLPTTTATATEPFEPSLTWANATATPDPFILKQRPAYVRKSTAAAATFGDVTALAGVTGADAQAAATAKAAAMEQNYISAATYALLSTGATGGQSKYEAIAADTLANVKLISLISNTDDHSLNGSVKLADTDATNRNSIGEAIIAPSAKAYEITICLAQRVAVTEDATQTAHPSTPIDYETMKYNTIKTVVFATEKAKTGSDLVASTDDVFMPGYSYNFRLKIYGLERIDITTTLSPWEYGGGVDVDTDN